MFTGENASILLT